MDKLYKYTSCAKDPDGDQVYLLFDWDDGNSSGWLGPYNSCEKIKAYHKWSKQGTYEIRAKAKDINGTQSEWSDPFIISFTKSKNVNIHNLLYWLLEKYPLIGKLLNFL